MLAATATHPPSLLLTGFVEPLKFKSSFVFIYFYLYFYRLFIWPINYLLNIYLIFIFIDIVWT